MLPIRRTSHWYRSLHQRQLQNQQCLPVGASILIGVPAPAKVPTPTEAPDPALSLTEVSILAEVLVPTKTLAVEIISLEDDQATAPAKAPQANA